MRLTFVCPSLACGGAERCLTLLTRGLLRKGHSVEVITLYGEESDFYILPAGARRIALGVDKVSPTALHGLWNNLGRLSRLRKAIKSTDPDVVISHIFRTNVLTLLAVGNATPCVIVEHNDPSLQTAGKIWEALRRKTYPRTKKLVSVSQGVDKCFSWLPREQRTVIYNPIALAENSRPSITSGTRSGTGRKLVAAMGRLTFQKGFDLLLAAFAKVAGQQTDWDLMIIGEGHLRGELESLAGKLGLLGRVTFTGLLSDAQAALDHSDLFVMASRFEGFPYAALEALAGGLPVIYTDCPSGPREIIREGIDGLLVPNGDVEALAAAMNHLMSEAAERQRLAARAPEVLERFGLDRVVAKWEALLLGL